MDVAVEDTGGGVGLCHCEVDGAFGRSVARLTEF